MTTAGAIHAFAYDLSAAAPQMLDLGEGRATAVSGSIVVGNSNSHAFAYDLSAATPQMVDLGTLGGPDSRATAVSGSIVVGMTGTESTLPAPIGTVIHGHAFAYDVSAPTPQMLDLGALPGGNSAATAVSGATVVGFSGGTPSGLYGHAVAWQLNDPNPEFVTSNGTQLELDGSPWRLFGASTYGTSNPGGTQSIEDEIALATAAGLNTLRVVDMFDVGGTDANAPYDETAWAHIDLLLSEMRDSGLHAILDLSAFRNHLQNRELFLRGGAAIASSYPIPVECSGTSGAELDRCVGARWCIENPASCANPYDVGSSGAWDTFLQFVATRVNTVTGVEYRADPTIAIVSFAGEPNAPNSGEPLKPTTQELTDFYARVFDQWKAHDAEPPRDLRRPAPHRLGGAVRQQFRHRPRGDLRAPEPGRPLDPQLLRAPPRDGRQRHEDGEDRDRRCDGGQAVDHGGVRVPAGTRRRHDLHGG